MKLLWSPAAWEAYLSWQKENPEGLKRLNELIREVQRTPFTGTGKPEPLRGDLTGWWSRRITKEHRLVYRVRGKGDEQFVEIAQCRYHY
ncbi:Txe/YoeB family addiction module toxin [Salinarimonas ramus]|uniref:Putative mRNA interferase YoeB n=1 Tax=Salinarimonas ramus TaxID=690164 RepID=A0A917QFV4_9HYPH|nr:Txe/YoeB family addiction module toxin [Salinarimonas ramus]GGK48558.1 addiction module protein [Salinarimonas ramus]